MLDGDMHIRFLSYEQGMRTPVKQANLIFIFQLSKRQDFHLQWLFLLYMVVEHSFMQV